METPLLRFECRWWWCSCHEHADGCFFSFFFFAWFGSRPGAGHTAGSGLLSFNAGESPGIKMYGGATVLFWRVSFIHYGCDFSGPEVSVTLAAGFIALVLVLHLLGKLFR